MTWDFNPKQLWCKQIERRLYELGSMVNGNVKTQAERLADVLEQVDELRQDVSQIRARVDKMAHWLKTHIGGDHAGPQT